MSFIKFIKNLFSNRAIYSSEKREGTVKFYNRTKGFGFITASDTDEEVFVHKSGLIDKIRRNDKVSFSVEKGKKGIHAIKVKRIK